MSTSSFPPYPAGVLASSQHDEDKAFADASEHVLYADSTNLQDTLAEAHIAFNLFLNNHFQLAEERMAVLSDKSMYHALGHFYILLMKAMFTCDRADLKIAFDSCDRASEVINRFRAKYSLADTLYRFGGSHKTLTDSEMHAELCYAESLLGKAVLSFFIDESLASFVKGAFKIRACYQTFKECQRILENENWKNRNVKMKEEFESGVRLGIGTFNLMLSTLPAKIVRLLEFVGFSGNKAVGMHELRVATTMESTLRMPLAGMTLLSWHLIASFIIGNCNPDIPFCERIINYFAAKYPNGAIILFHRARFNLVKGNIDNAIYFYRKSINAQNVFKQFHHACLWELIFANAYLKKWERSATCALKLFEENKWSRCCYKYMLATFIDADKSVPKRRETVAYLLKDVPRIRLRIAGKSIPVEKFCEKKALRYEREGQLFFAHYEFLYFWGGFGILKGNNAIIHGLIDDMDSSWNNCKSNDINDICLYYFLRGALLNVLGHLDKAELCMLRVIEYENQLTDHNYLAPNACFELACIRRDMSMIHQVHPLLNKALTYRSYSLENKLHFRIHAAREAFIEQWQDSKALTSV